MNWEAVFLLILQQPSVIVPFTEHAVVLGFLDQVLEGKFEDLGIAPLVEGYVAGTDSLVKGGEASEL